MSGIDPLRATPHSTEQDRLAALARCGILDTPREKDFDDIVKRAAQICGTPIAAISFVDDLRIWFKAEVGLGVRDAPFGSFFCSRAILQPELVVVVPDASCDARFAGQASIDGVSPLRFYTAALLRTAEGVPLGTLCVADDHPRRPSEAQLEMLKALASQVMTLLELKAERKQRCQQDELQKLILDSATDYAIVTSGLDGVVTSWNRGAERILGWTAAEMLGRDSKLIFTPEDRDRGAPEREMQAALEQGRAQDRRWHLRKDGSRFWGNGIAMPMGGTRQGFLKILRDETEQRKTEEALRESEARYRAIAELGPDAIIIYRIDRILYGNAAAVALTGAADIGDLIGRSPLEFVEPHFHDEARKYVDRMLSSGRSGRTSGRRWRRLDGEIMLVESTATPLFWQGELAVQSMVRDVTHRIRADTALRESETRYRALVQISPQIVWFTDAEGSNTFCNAYWYEHTGLPPGDTSFAGLAKVIHPSQHQRVFGSWKRALATQASCEEEVLLRRASDGSYRWFLARTMPVRSENGEVTRWIGIAIDIHDRKLAEERLAISEESLRLATEAGEAGTWDLDLISGALNWSERMRAMFGIWSQQSCSMADFYDGLHPDDRERIRAAFAEALDPAMRAPYDVEYRTVGKDDGVVRWVAAKGKGLFDSNGRCVRAVGTALDITARKASEARHIFLLTLGDRLRGQGDANAVMAVASEALGRQLGVSRAGYAETVDSAGQFMHFGRGWSDGSVAQWRGIHAMDAFGPAAADELRRGRTLVLSDVGRDPRTSQPETLAFYTKLEAAAAVSVSLIRDGRLSAGFYVHSARPRVWTDTEVQLIEEVAERTWEAVERAHAESAVYAGQARQSFLLALTDQLRGPGDTHELLSAASEMMGRHFGANRVGYGHLHESEDVFNYDVCWSDGNIPPLLGVFPASAFGAKIVASLRQGHTVMVEDLFAAAISDEPETRKTARDVDTRAILVVPLVRAGKLRSIVYLNSRAPRRWTSEEVALTEEVAERTRQVIERGEAEAALRDLNATLETRVKQRTEELLEAEEALRQSQKMEAVGQLTGGIAHDFNNLMTGILGSLDLLQRRLDNGQFDKLQRYTSTAMNSAQRAAALTQRLLAFSRRQPLDPKPIEANKLIAGMEELLCRTLGPSIDLHLDLASDLWGTLADPNQLESAILNLAINSRDAMPVGGRLTIETAGIRLDENHARSTGGEAQAGDYVRITVSDTGVGMTPEVMSRIFEPFYTTKPLGRGTGLGLSMLYGFVRQSGGHVRAQSQVGAGTCFELYLPRYHGGLSAEADAASDAAIASSGCSGTVLIVEDESAVRALVVETLGDMGYTAAEASDGPSGLCLLQSDLHVDLLVTDVGLPGLNGRQLADAARLRRPQLPVLFITGYAYNVTSDSGALEPGMELMTKPFTIDALAQKIRGMIEDSRRTVA